MPKRGSRLHLVQPSPAPPPPEPPSFELKSFEVKVASAAAASAAIAYALDRYADGPFQIFDYWNLPTNIQLAICVLFGSARRRHRGAPPPAA